MEFMLLILATGVVAHGIKESDLLDEETVNHVGILDLLDQYVLHVEKQENREVDLLDQYVSHVERGKRLAARETFGNKRRGGKVISRHRARRDLLDESVLEDSSRQWVNTLSLDPEGHVGFSWLIQDDGRLSVQVVARTRGYVGVGFSPGGSMRGADIVVGWVDDTTGEPHLMDCHGSDKNEEPMVDKEQNYILRDGRQNETHTALWIDRELDTCDAVGDFTLGSDTIRLIWATHPDDPTVEDGRLRGFKYHGKEQRGTHSLHLLHPPASNVPRDPPAQHWDVTLSDFVVPDNMDTLYWCKIFKVPPLKGKHHMIGYEPLLEPGHEGYVHHMLLYECGIRQQSVPLFEDYVTQAGESCYSPSMPQGWDQCLTPIVAWAIGSQGEFLPEHVGLPLAEGPDSTYFMLEIHYDNPAFNRVVDNSGIRLYYTEHLRKNDGAIWVNGITVTPLHIVPPLQPEYRSAGYCNSECTQAMFPETGVKLVSVLLHSHLAGKKLRLRHVRDGVELPRIAEDNHYDFNYQQTRSLPREVTVLPGDQLITECVYQTPNRTNPTFGGLSTKQEMCLAFVLYYPRTALAGCYSMTPVKYFFNTFGVREFYDLDMATVERMFLKLDQGSDEAGERIVKRSTTTTSTAPTFLVYPPGDEMDEELNRRAIAKLKKMDGFVLEGGDGDGQGEGGIFGDLVIREPLGFHNKSFTSHLYDLPWDRVVTQKIEESFFSGQHMIFCRKRDDTLAFPAMISMIPNFTELPDTSSEGSRCPGKSNPSLRVESSTSTKATSSTNCVLGLAWIITLLGFLNA